MNEKLIGRAVRIAILIVCAVLGFVVGRESTASQKGDIQESTVELIEETAVIEQSKQGTELVIEVSGIDTVGDMSTEEPEPEEEQVLPFSQEKLDSLQEIKMQPTSNLRLRELPTKDSETLAVIPKSTVLQVKFDDETDWSYTTCNGYSGYVKNSYLVEFDETRYKDVPLEYQYQDLVIEMIDVFELDIDESVIYGMMWVENRFGSDDESSAGAKGIMQVMPSTFRLLKPTFEEQYPNYANLVTNDIKDKQTNIIIGMYCIRAIQDELGLDSAANNISRILTSYNRGTGGANDYHRTTGTYSSSYSKSVINAANTIRENGKINE